MTDRRKYRGARVKLNGIFYTGISVEKGQDLLVKLNEELSVLETDLNWYKKLRSYKGWDEKFADIVRANSQLHRQYITDVGYLGDVQYSRQTTVSGVLLKHYSKLYQAPIDESQKGLHIEQSTTHGIYQFVYDVTDATQIPSAYLELTRLYYLSKIKGNFSDNPFTLLNGISKTFSLTKYHKLKALKHRLQSLAEGRLENLLVDVATFEELEGYKNGNDSV